MYPSVRTVHILQKSLNDFGHSDILVLAELIAELGADSTSQAYLRTEYLL